MYRKKGGKKGKKTSNNKEKTEIQERKSTIQGKKERKKHTMRITTAGRESIACKPKTDGEGGVESSSRWGREKRPGSGRGRQSRRVGDQRRIQNNLEEESLSESPKSSTNKVCQTSRSNRKTTHQ
jgi:hypothetical protein